MKTTRFAMCLASVIACCGALAARASADPVPIYGLAGIAYQPARTDPLAHGAAILAFASTAGASHVERVTLVPVDHTTCGTTDYVILDLMDVDASGALPPTPLYSGTTACAGSGSWSAGVAAFDLVLAYDLPAGHTLAALWHSAGAGTTLPSGAWRIE